MPDIDKEISKEFVTAALRDLKEYIEKITSPETTRPGDEAKIQPIVRLPNSARLSDDKGRLGIVADKYIYETHKLMDQVTAVHMAWAESMGITLKLSSVSVGGTLMDPGPLNYYTYLPDKNHSAPEVRDILKVGILEKLSDADLLKIVERAKEIHHRSDEISKLDVKYFAQQLRDDNNLLTGPPPLGDKQEYFEFRKARPTLLSMDIRKQIPIIEALLKEANIKIESRTDDQTFSRFFISDPDGRAWSDFQHALIDVGFPLHIGEEDKLKSVRNNANEIYSQQEGFEDQSKPSIAPKNNIPKI